MYEASNEGRIRSWYHLADPAKPRILRLVRDKKGYLKVCLHHEGRQHDRRVHQLVLLAFVGEPNDLVARHLDGDQSNNALVNLQYGTQSENVQDSIRHGTQYNARKTHCNKGHLFDEANTYIVVGRSRRCRACDAATAHARHVKRMAAKRQ